MRVYDDEEENKKKYLRRTNRRTNKMKKNSQASSKSSVVQKIPNSIPTVSHFVKPRWQNSEKKKKISPT